MNNHPLQFGTWLSIGSPVIAELASLSGFDWVLFDLEHGCYAEADLPNQMRAVRGSDTSVIVRVGGVQPETIARILDWGAHGIMVPCVESVDQANRIVDAAYYAPSGSRGFARTVRAYDYGLRSPSEAMTPPLIMAQIESLKGVEIAETIARVEGIDVLFIGPSDLRHELEHHPMTSSQRYDECLNRVVLAASRASKAAGILIRDIDAISSHVELGFTYLAVTSDLAILRDVYQRILSR